jgi:ankyrin repeat protein
MAENSDGVVVTEEMLTEVALAGDLNRLTIWAQQGVRVTSGYPLYSAARGGYSAVARLLVEQMGANVSQGMPRGPTPLSIAGFKGNLAVLRCLVELGAEVGAVENCGNTALLTSARGGHYDAMRYLLEEVGADMDHVNNDGDTVWDKLTLHLETVADNKNWEVDIL